MANTLQKPWVAKKWLDMEDCFNSDQHLWWGMGYSLRFSWFHGTKFKYWFVVICYDMIQIILWQIFNTIGDCILKEGLPGMIIVLSNLFVHAGVTPPVNDIEQICRCPDKKSNAPNLCHQLPRLLYYAIYDKMTCMLNCNLLAITIT